jgi:hypothetical protein
MRERVSSTRQINELMRERVSSTRQINELMKERESKVRLFWDLLPMDKKKKKSRGEREHKILVLAGAVCYLPASIFPQPPQVWKHWQNLTFVAN